MTQKIEFLFDVGSPTAYLAWSQLPALCQRTGAELVYTPVLLGGIFKATGNNPPGAVPAKGMYMMRDLARYSARYQVPLTMNPHFPVNPITPHAHHHRRHRHPGPGRRDHRPLQRHVARALQTV